MKYVHFLITKFNLPRLWVTDKNGRSTQSEAWLEQRVALFKKFCLPSIVAQTRKDFIWLLLFYDKTPDKYKKFNDELAAKYPFYKPCYLNENESKDLIPYLNKAIKKMVAGDEIIITTRFDNDDSLAVDAMEELESFVEEEGCRVPYFISFPKGIQYYPKYNISMVLEWEENHFLTYVEPFSERLMTVNCCNHTKVKEHHTLKLAGKDKEMWMEICHERNVSNDIHHFRWAINPLKHGYESDRFGLTPSPLFRYNHLKFRLFVVLARLAKIIRRAKERLSH